MKTSVIIFLLILSGLSLKAQTPKKQPPEYRAKSRVELLDKFLHLSEQQTDKIEDIYTELYRSQDSLIKVLQKQRLKGEDMNYAVLNLSNATEEEAKKKISPLLDNDQQITHSRLKTIVRMGTSTSIRNISTPE